jgi:molybdenum-dependent DNA-binding transcriptional regulator ModE
MTHTNQRIIKNKLGLLRLAEEFGNISRACQVMGFSRDTFYRYRSALEQGGIEALLERTRRKPNPNPKNRTDETTEAAVVAFARRLHLRQRSALRVAAPWACVHEKAPESA